MLRSVDGPSLGSSPISHRLQFPDRCPSADRAVAVPPRSPIGYNLIQRCAADRRLRFLPDLPSATIGSRCDPELSGLRFLPDLPSATILTDSGPRCEWLRFLPDLPSATMDAGRRQPAVLVAVPPRSPIGYNLAQERKPLIHVAVPPRSPIGYNMSKRGYYGPDSCGSSPISHRLQSDRYRSTLTVTLRFLPDLPSATING